MSFSILAGKFGFQYIGNHNTSGCYLFTHICSDIMPTDRQEQ